MADGINLDGAGMDMRPGETSAIVASIQEAAATVRQAWVAALGPIAALDTQLGKGPMGRQFAAENYNPSVQQLVAAMDQLGASLEEKAGFGAHSVREYTATEEHNAQQINNV